MRLGLESTGEIVAVAACYIKLHSMGEFVFDQEWARAAYEAGIEYYPKLVLAVPFTPASGRRILTKDDGEREGLLWEFGKRLAQVCRGLGISGVHALFLEADEAEVLGRVGFLIRKGIQYHFTNYRKGNVHGAGISENGNENGNGKVVREKYSSFEDYLQEFKSKRRIKLRRERRSIYEDENIDVSVVAGDSIMDDLFEQMFYIYKTTIDKMWYGRQYLTRSFFSKLCASRQFRKNICFVIARRRDSNEIIAGTFNLAKNGRMYGRYWGCFEEVRNLHFEVCYYRAIQYCIEQGMESMEPGAGGGDFKFGRGFEPVRTMSAHYFTNSSLSEAVRHFVTYEASYVDQQVDYMCENSVLRAKTKQKSSS